VGQEVEIAAFCDSIAWIDGWRNAVKDAGGAPDSVGGHADIAETSLMMHLRPDSVRRDRFEVGHLGMLTEEELHAMWKNGIKSVTHNGIIGDPHGSTPAIGERCLEAIADLLVTSFGK
jgi:creatinine amidohydrolase